MAGRASETAGGLPAAGRASAEPAAAYPLLRRPIDLGGLRLPHRIVMGSMHLNMEHDPAGLAAFYAERARGGAALIITGGAAVNRVGAGSAGYSIISEPAAQETWSAAVEAVHAEGGRIALQLFHAGRYAFESSFGLTPVAPSAVYSRFSRCEPEELSEEGIRSTIADFAAGARAAVDLGFDAIEVMGSEGYLINEFASPVTNRRDDAWGGDAERRRAFPLAVLGAVLDAAGPVPVIARTSGADLVPDSSTPEEADALAVAYAEAGAAAINVGIGWHEARVPTVQSMVPHVAWGDVAGRMRASLAAAGAAVPLIASNRINTLAQAERVLADGQGDLVSMARPFLADPHIVAASFAGNAALVNPCIGCNEACIDRSFGLERISCTVNPRAGRELDFAPDPLAWRASAGAGAGGAIDTIGTIDAEDGAAGAGGSPVADTGGSPVADTRGPARASTPAGRPRRRIAVVGSGPAGLEAARAAAFAGAEVTLFEAHERIGGQFLLAGIVPGKSDFLGTVDYFTRELARRRVHVVTGHRVAGAAELAGFDHVILAAGVLPRRVEIPGLPEPLSAGVPETDRAGVPETGRAGLLAAAGAEPSGPRRDGPAVLDYAAAFAHPELVGERVAVIGAGGIAVDLAHFLVEPPLEATSPEAREDERRARFLAANAPLTDGLAGQPGATGRGHPRPARRVTVMRRSGSIGAGMGITTRWAAVQAIRAAGVETLTGVAYLGVEREGVRIRHEDAERLIDADTIIVAAGQVPNDALAGALATAGIPATVVGGALEASGLNAVAAFEQGMRAGDAAARENMRHGA